MNQQSRNQKKNWKTIKNLGAAALNPRLDPTQTLNRACDDGWDRPSPSRSPALSCAVCRWLNSPPCFGLGFMRCHKVSPHFSPLKNRLKWLKRWNEPDVSQLDVAVAVIGFHLPICRSLHPWHPGQTHERAARHRQILRVSRSLGSFHQLWPRKMTSTCHWATPWM